MRRSGVRFSSRAPRKGWREGLLASSKRRPPSGALGGQTERMSIGDELLEERRRQRRAAIHVSRPKAGRRCSDWSRVI
jgi:hypothetical protein